jgi:hypothetical protein
VKRSVDWNERWLYAALIIHCVDYPSRGLSRSRIKQAWAGTSTVHYLIMYHRLSRRKTLLITKMFTRKKSLYLFAKEYLLYREKGKCRQCRNWYQIQNFQRQQCLWAPTPAKAPPLNRIIHVPLCTADLSLWVTVLPGPAKHSLPLLPKTTAILPPFTVTYHKHTFFLLFYVFQH